MTSRRLRFRPWLWICLIALVTVIALGTRHSKPALQSRRLPDGSTISIAAMTQGSKHRFAPGGPGRQLFSFLIPEKQVFIPAYRTLSVSEPDPKTPVLWLTHVDPRPPAPASPFTISTIAWTVFDGKGGERPIIDQSMGFAPNNQYNVQAFSLRHYPRRGPSIHLRRYANGRHPYVPPVVDFTVDNPYPGPYPQWTAPPPPVRVAEPGVIATLRTFRNGVDSQKPTKPPQWAPVFDAGTYVEVETQSTDPAERWQPIDVAFIDATGNVYPRKRYGTTEHKGNLSRLWAPWMLPYDEDAWKVRVELARTAAAKFQADEVWTVKNIPVPDWGKTIELADKQTVHGIGLKAQGIRRATPSALSVFVDHDVAGYEMSLVRLVDDRGRDVVRHEDWDHPTRTSLGWDRFEFAFDIRGGAKTLTATLAFHQTRFVELLARPTHVIPPPRRNGG